MFFFVGSGGGSRSSGISGSRDNCSCGSAMPVVSRRYEFESHVRQVFAIVFVTSTNFSESKFFCQFVKMLKNPSF